MDLAGLINQHKNKVFSLAALILALIIAVNIYKSQMANLDSLKTAIGAEEKKNRALGALGKMENQIDAYRKLLVKRDANLSMADMSDIAREAGVKLTSIKPAEEKALPEYTEYVFDLTVAAPDYDSLAKFINKIEVYPSFYIIDELNISAPAYDEKKELNARLRVSAAAILD